ncbi:hypothetical protein M0812_03285 [Anaeramoeba flamelloides]|uniref:Uncharacterized protein n=1 Tax=Anaeramoeba flamelloides TaxID=1746091 RepID=A0AAV8ADN4_9EUKA|nr:hypothetical protein M0812_03285 [Anaeramoeba flamelloides]
MNQQENNFNQEDQYNYLTEKLENTLKMLRSKQENLKFDALILKGLITEQKSSQNRSSERTLKSNLNSSDESLVEVDDIPNQTQDKSLQSTETINEMEDNTFEICNPQEDLEIDSFWENYAQF